jgi:hypothetical protein
MPAKSALAISFSPDPEAVIFRAGQSVPNAAARSSLARIFEIWKLLTFQKRLTSLNVCGSAREP